MGRSESIGTPRDAIPFRLREAIAYDGICALFEAMGRWKYPARASGDLEEMSFLDKVYWLYKTSRPVRRPVRESGLEVFFAQQRFDSRLPDGYRVDGEIRVSAVGDLMPHLYLNRSAKSLYAKVSDLIFDADIAMANLECVVLDTGKTDLSFNMTSGPLLAMDETAFDVISSSTGKRYHFMATASNHSLDLGESGVVSTIRALRGRAIAFHGTNEGEEDAERATIIERNGIRIGIVSHTFGTNGRRAPPGRSRIVNHTKLNRDVRYIDFSSLQTQFRHCIESKADFVFAQLHWGMEFEFYPRPEQLAVAHHLAELGADAIIGHHPHVVQPMEFFHVKRDRHRVVPIFYSLGNVTNPFSLAYMWRSAVARLTLTKGKLPDGSSRTLVREARTEEIEQVLDNVSRTISLRRVAP